MTPAESTILAIDGGNSKTDIAIVRGDGTLLRRARGGPFVPHLIGPVAAVASLAPAILEALGELGRVDHIAAYLANADLPIEEARIRDAISAHHWATTVLVENDTVALLRAGTDSPNAVAVVCGAGINCIAVADDGRRIRFPALGRITGDWGGGVSLAKEVLWSTSRAEDGRGPATALAARVAEHFDRPTAVSVSEAIHLGDIDRERSHELIPILFDAAALGDPVALGLVQRQAAEIALMVSASLNRLGLVEVETDIVLGGGILGSRHPTLLDAVRADLATAAPRGRITIFEGVPVIGAALLGIEQVWAEDRGVARSAALEKVRQQFGAARG
ncbi:MAG: N-acetylglucosamine kinase [Salinibacterium sp.]|nr:N-acetylglucosamine kinase [Salinibacterium sp.]